MDIELSQEVIDVIDNFMKRDRPLFDYGLEKFCSEQLKEMVEIEFRKKCSPIVRLKGSEKVINAFDKKYDTYFSGSSAVNYFWWNGRSPYGYKGFLKAKCMMYFESISVKLINLFIKEEYGDLELAILFTKSFLELFRNYEQWFEDRRNRFMEDMTADIQKVTGVSVGKKPQSHGGVANLLKVLTQTMEKQGSDIRNIAKVQYAVCIQAGIYIPDEFMRDVAVTLDMNLENEKGTVVE